ncbi:MAG: prolipoprotein diacylglyceryl transferase, partial [Oscillospiraceae bacterium]|nr:prolipoprotein diacylglyceryl transferase [Oscillospiraceae bacterium]
ESVWCLIGFIALHFYSKKLRTFDGEIMLLYLAWYGLGRAWIEGLRTDSLMAGDLRISQIVAAVCFVVCTALVIVFKILTEKKHIPLYVNTDACRELEEADEKAEQQRREKKLAKKTEEAPSILSEDAEDVTLNGAEETKSAEEDEQSGETSETEDAEQPAVPEDTEHNESEEQ